METRGIGLNSRVVQPARRTPRVESVWAFPVSSRLVAELPSDSVAPEPTELVVVAGQTASGKSAFAIELALELARLGRPAEIVNADAMQLYRGMDIGTAKIPSDQRRGVSHHLIDVLAPSEDCSVVRYRELSTPVIESLLQRGVLPIITGGSMLYIAGITDVLDFSPSDEVIRANLERELETLGNVALHERLFNLDAAAAAKIPANNGRRVVRALEVIALTGQPYRASMPQPTSRWRTVFIGLAPDQQSAKKRIVERAAAMLKEGLLEECARLQTEGLGRTARKAIGYEQGLAMLRGEILETEAIKRITTLTDQYAKRQRSWFRRDPRIHWLSEPYDLAAAIRLIG